MGGQNHLCLGCMKQHRLTGMICVAILLQLLTLISAQMLADERFTERFDQPLGGIIQLTERALQTPAVTSRVEAALEQLAARSNGCRKYRISNICSGTSQVVNGFGFEFVVKVESHPTERCLSEMGRISEFFKITIYEPVTEGAETRYTFEKI